VRDRCAHGLLRPCCTYVAAVDLPSATLAGSPSLAAALRARPQGRCYGSPTCSDWVFLNNVDVVKCGPGNTHRSHTPDEWVSLDEVRAARAFYATLAQEYLS
jgi:acetylornithine deacetylase